MSSVYCIRGSVFCAGVGNALFLSKDTGKTWIRVANLPYRTNDGDSTTDRSYEVADNRIVEIVPLNDSAILLRCENGDLFRFNEYQQILSRCKISDSILVDAIISNGKILTVVGTDPEILRFGGKNGAMIHCLAATSLDNGSTWTIQDRWKGKSVEGTGLMADNHLVVLYDLSRIRSLRLDRTGKLIGVTLNEGVEEKWLPVLRAIGSEVEYHAQFYFVDSLHGFLRGILPSQPRTSGPLYRWHVFETIDGGVSWIGRPDSVFICKQVRKYTGTFWVGASKAAVLLLDGSRMKTLHDLRSDCAGNCTVEVDRLNVDSDGNILIHAHVMENIDENRTIQSVSNWFFDNGNSTWRRLNYSGQLYR